MMQTRQPVIVTGGAGFIGSNFVQLVIADGKRTVINLDKLTYAGNPSNLEAVAQNPRHVFIRGDIGDRKLLTELLHSYQPNAIVNFAAESHVDRSISAPDDFIQTNVVGSFSLLQAVREYWEGLPEDRRNFFRFLHVSTDEVYGSLGKDDPAFTEKTPYGPNSPYSASKASSDHLARAYHHTYGLPVLTTNCSNNYGPYQFPEKLIPLVVYRALNGKSIPVYGDGANIRDWLYVIDHCRAILSVMEKGIPGEVYNIGGNSEKTNLEVVRTICSLLDEIAPRPDQRLHETLIKFVTDRPGHDHRYAIDTSKIQHEIGWEPSESFDSGIRKTIQWYLENLQWVENVTSGAYQKWIETNYERR